MPDNSTYSFSLRPLLKSDLAAIARWFQNVGDLALFDRNTRMPYDERTCAKLWDMTDDATGGPTDSCWFAITTSPADVVGIVGLERISPVNRDAVVALYMDHATRRQGIGIRAASLMLDFAFRQLGLNRVTSYYRDDNSGSRGLTRQAGFEIEGTMRQAWFADGAFHDMIVVGILASDWAARRGQLAAELGSDIVIAFGGPGASIHRWPPDREVPGGTEA